MARSVRLSMASGDGQRWDAVRAGLRNDPARAQPVVGAVLLGQRTLRGIVAGIGRDEAEKMRDKLKDMGLSGNLVPK